MTAWLNENCGGNGWAMTPSGMTCYDVILSTTLAGPPPKLGYFEQNGDVQTFAERVTEYLSVTPLHNATGTPAMSVPLHWTADGLPSACILRAATVRRRPCWRLPSWRRRNRGSIACRRCKERMEVRARPADDARQCRSGRRPPDRVWCWDCRRQMTEPLRLQ